MDGCDRCLRFRRNCGAAIDVANFSVVYYGACALERMRGIPLA
jgi:hypothetical protein